MADSAKPMISQRKQPMQARSAHVVASILEAAAQVLREGGPGQFTTARVAERAGVSIGSLYQYFPNKAALLFRLQADEWAETGGLLAAILDDAGTPPEERLRKGVLAFVRSERQEATLREALQDAAPLYREAPEARARTRRGAQILRQFLDEAMPAASPAQRALAADVLDMTLISVGKRISIVARDHDELEAYGSALADMLVAAVARWNG